MNNKALALNDSRVVAATFDLEQVLLCPKLEVSSLFYRRKLAVYNLTIYRLDSSDVTCHMWHEGQGRRGSCEIASAVAKFFVSLPDSVKKIIMYSDTCSGQNRNQHFSAMCLSAIQTYPVEKIDRIYKESGHSQMECDSAHSAIESALRNKDLYCPTDIFQNVALARKKNPFIVEYLQTSDIWNYKLLSKKILKNRSWDSNGQKVHWLKIKWMRYEKRCPSVILFGYNYHEDFRKL